MTPDLSVVVVAYEMARELPRTLFSLSPAYQRDIDPERYEVVVVDNGSAAPLEVPGSDEIGVSVTHLRLPGDSRSRSPAPAANAGIAAARGRLVGLIVDGARIASPGLLRHALLADRLADEPIIATLAWHLGPSRHGDAAASGYDQASEDALLTSIDWERDGYELFRASTLANSSGRGWFGSLGESSALFLHDSTWSSLGGLDERFELPGGGLVNHDLYRRACAIDGATLIMLLGEGTFHQIHSGAATSGRLTIEEMRAEYERLRGVRHARPENRPVYVGTFPESALDHVMASARIAKNRAERSARPGRNPG